ncbi:hypothetical protein J1G42_16560 [Cellulomonas sp. zg-ZUI222]|uniref:hypothetical protein n=1 Tax=Cellulomonas wangleii TaxID=2816956 RepID=UPI001A9512A4|nr:hypothetical protein [Cellulomonas wangleii]MBO0922435.1 hypothetical protein [Cellulomonas wangleii]
MTTRLLLEGPDLEELVEQVREELGSRARIVRAERVRSGGFAGFFARERFEVTVDVPDEPAPPGRPRRHAVVPVGSGLEGLLAAADAADGDDGADGASGTDAARATEEFAAVLDQVRTLVGLPVPEVAAPERAAALAVPPARTPAAPAPPAAPSVGSTGSTGSALRAELERLGVPAHLLGTGPVTLGGVLGRLPRPPAPPRGPGQLLVVVGEGDGPRAVARTLAVRWGLPDGCVHEPDVAGPVVVPAREPTSPQVVAVRVGPDHHDRALAARALAAIAPDQVWAVTDARTKPADVTAWVTAVGAERRVDALAVHGLLDTTAPGTVLEPGLPVAWVDGVPASRLVWAAALGQDLDAALT